MSEYTMRDRKTVDYINLYNVANSIVKSFIPFLNNIDRNVLKFFIGVYNERNVIVAFSYSNFTEGDNIENTLEKTYILMFKQAFYVINLLKKKDENLMKLIKKNKLEKWSKKLFKKKDLNRIYKINKNSSKKLLKKKIRSTNTSKYKPYILLHQKKFFLSDE